MDELFELCQDSFYRQNSRNCKIENENFFLSDVQITNSQQHQRSTDRIRFGLYTCPVHVHHNFRQSYNMSKSQGINFILSMIVWFPTPYGVASGNVGAIVHKY